VAEATRLAIALNTKDKPEQVRKVIERLLHLPIDLWWFDGSTTPAGQKLHEEYPQFHRVRHNVRGSGDYAAVQALTEMLADPKHYTHVGLIEDDVLLPKDWLGRTMSLFENSDGLEVGAVSARAYEDRVLLQADGYAVMHNLGWGQVVFSREAARLTLQHYRTGWTSENRRLFARLTGIDIGQFWAFRAQEQWICSDWGNDAVLAQNGLASLALCPCEVEMLAQDPPLEAQRLRLARHPLDLRRDDRVLDRYARNLRSIRDEKLFVDARPLLFRRDDGGHLCFAHQFGFLGARWKGDWRVVHQLGFGPFTYRAVSNASCEIDLSGPIELLIGGGETGGNARITDMASGYEIEPVFNPAGVGDQMFVTCVVPANISFRTIRIDKLTPGVTIYGVCSRETQAVRLAWRFDATCLPPAAEPIVKPGTITRALTGGMELR
jgi:hypothetical protein